MISACYPYQPAIVSRPYGRRFLRIYVTKKLHKIPTNFAVLNVNTVWELFDLNNLNSELRDKTLEVTKSDVKGKAFD